MSAFEPHYLPYLIRLSRARLAAVPNPEPPACNVPTRAGWCVLDLGHPGGHLPLPRTYPPKDVTAVDERSRLLQAPRKTDGGPSVTEFLRSKGELA